MAESSSQELLEGMAALDSEGAAASRFDAIERALALQYETHEKIVGSTREVTKALRLMQRQSWWPMYSWEDLKDGLLLRFGNRDDPKLMWRDAENRRFIHEMVVNLRKEQHLETVKNIDLNPATKEMEVVLDSSMETDAIQEMEKDSGKHIHDAVGLQPVLRTPGELYEMVSSGCGYYIHHRIGDNLKIYEPLMDRIHDYLSNKLEVVKTLFPAMMCTR
ncbi:hypothetical protein Bca4012_056516 [Brassica carinata]|uniref:Uncharacterized protein n=1 Tax=Brassica carinata TaxID=52824 RepID=A0A8X7W1C4_BRACI|nr:hypothetical protein Bca52824_013658 [Brassica carinata]